MKKLLMAVAALLTISCEKADLSLLNQEKVKEITFCMAGDLQAEQQPMTRALTADGKTLSDLWLLDYDQDGNLLQQLHKTADDADQQSPTMALTYGTHTIYAIASRGTGAELSTENKTVTWATTSDTFWASTQLTVSASSSATQEIQLARVATKLQVVVNDAMPATVTTVDVTPQTWYYGLDYTTGEATAPATSTPRTMTIPAAKAGQTGVALNLYGLSPAADWTTNISITAKDAEGNTLGTASKQAVPMARNRVTRLSGSLFASTRALSLAMADTWGEQLEASW